MAKVLVVDDSPIMRRNLSAILTKAGHTIVAEAANGELGIKEYEKHKPDLVTMDITMPVMDGIGAVKRIVSFDPEAKVIMISALDQKYMVLNAIQSGAKHYIIKPFSYDKVLSVVDEVLSIPRGNPAANYAYTQGKNSGIPKKLPKVVNSTINGINTSISSINSSLKELDKNHK